MISFTSILTAVKGASLATKVGLSVGVVAIIAGGTAGTVAIINANKPYAETQIVAGNSNDDNYLLPFVIIVLRPSSFSNLHIFLFG